MVDYCTVEEVKNYLTSFNAGTVDDAIIGRAITDASRAIDRHCNRQFFASYETRYYDALADVNYPTQTLTLDKDLLSVGTLFNGNGTAIPSTAYVLNPANFDQKFNIQLKWSANVWWEYEDDPMQAISVVGTWGWNLGTVPPDEINNACVRYSSWLYMQRNAVFQVSGAPDDGLGDVPDSLPPDIQRRLRPFVRQTFTSIAPQYNYGYGWW